MLKTNESKNGLDKYSTTEIINKLNTHSGTTAQDSIHAELTKRLINEQTPKWVNIAMLILTAVILGLTIYLALFK